MLGVFFCGVGITELPNMENPYVYDILNSFFIYVTSVQKRMLALTGIQYACP
jgi:hypothetical protein